MKSSNGKVNNITKINEKQLSEIDSLRIELLAMKRAVAQQAHAAAESALNEELLKVFRAADLNENEWMIDTNLKRFVPRTKQDAV